MRCSARLLRCIGLVVGPTHPLLRGAARTADAPAKPPRAAARTAASGGGVSKGTLASFCPAIAATWMTAASNKLLQPQHVTPACRKLAWWCCPSCGQQFTKRIDLHVAAGGECVHCRQRPSATRSSAQRKTSKSSTRAGRASAELTGSASARSSGGTSDAAAAASARAAVVAHRCRPDSSRATLAAENANRLAKSVADGSYLRRTEQRILLPMLAKNYEKEEGKISNEEIVAVSPKLDGIRCIAAYDAAAKRILFFSRAGTLFECCDARIEPSLRSLFESDPTLVLDGELYNDSVNHARIISTLAALPSASSPTAALLALFAEELRRVNPCVDAGALAAACAGLRGDARKAARASSAGEVISFEQLTSAIRTTRERRTPDIAALQAKLQYQVFDVLYCARYPAGGDVSPPFRLRYAHLTELIAKVQRSSRRTAADGSTSVVRLVPSLFCSKRSVEALLRVGMMVGYEGVMVRRDGLTPCADPQHGGFLSLPSVDAAEASTATRPAGRPHRHAARSVPAKGSSREPPLDAEALTRDVHQAQQVVQAAVQCSGSARASPAARAKDSSSSGGGGRGDRGGGYGYGQRSSTLLKFKVMQDAEFVIVSAVEGKGKWIGCLGAFVCQTKDRKKTFTVTPASTDAQKKRMWATWRRDYKGKALTVQYQELTPDGIPRFPVGKGVRGAADGKDWI